MSDNRQRLDELLRRERRAGRVPTVVANWAAVGVAASPLSADRQTDLIGRLRSSGLRRPSELPPPSTHALLPAIREFAGGRDMVVVVGWDVDEEPVVLVPSTALDRSEANLRVTYPDGFVVLDQPLTSALIIDFDEDDRTAIYINRVVLSPVE